MDQGKSVRVAVIQAAPVIMNRKLAIDKTVSLTTEAARRGAEIVLFPEAFVPGYPRGLAFGAKVGSRTAAGRTDWSRYCANAVAIPGPETDILSQTARENSVYLTVGVIEKEYGNNFSTLYCSVVYFGPDGALLGKHRKLKPTGSERLIWGEGDGSTLEAVDTPYGRMGAIICWENYMPLARATMYAQRTAIYLAPTADARDTWQATIRHIALEGRCFVLSCNQFVTKEMYPTDLACYDELVDAPVVMCRGGSAIVTPLGEYLAGPLYDKEDILLADLELNLIGQGLFDFDPVGHYARPDVFQLTVNTRKNESTIWTENGI